MKKMHWITSVILSLSVIVILLITSLQLAMYADFSFYEKEYSKYDVLTDLEMEMDDVMHVTHEMMDYLKGDKEELSVVTTVEGIKQDFFNEQDRLHMADVKNLFIAGLNLRLWAVVVLIVFLLMLWITKADWKYVIPRAFHIAIGITAVVTGILAFAFSRDFSAAFTKFHEIFFTNDLWLFDPTEDYMIRMLPEGLFSDMVVRIGILFVGGLLFLWLITFIWRKKTNINLTNE